KPAAARSADDAHGNGLPDSKRISDSQDNVSHFQLIAIGYDRGWEAFPIDFQDGHIGRRISSNYFCIKFLFARRQRDLHLIGALDDVVGSENVSIGGDNDSRPEALLCALTGLHLPATELVAEELPQQRVIHQWRAAAPISHGHG